MGLLSRLFGRKDEPSAASSAAPEPVCPHAALIPRWDSGDDIGKAELISTYTCESCRMTFSRTEGLRILATSADALRIPEKQRA